MGVAHQGEGVAKPLSYYAYPPPYQAAIADVKLALPSHLLLQTLLQELGLQFCTFLNEIHKPSVSVPCLAPIIFGARSLSE